MATRKAKAKAAPTTIQENIKALRIWGISWYTKKRLLQPEGRETCFNCVFHGTKQGQAFLSCKKSATSLEEWTHCADDFPACALFSPRVVRLD